MIEDLIKSSPTADLQAAYFMCPELNTFRHLLNR